MSEYTPRFNLLRLTTDDLSEDSFKFSDADRVLIDTLLYMGAEGHHHTGGAASLNAPDTAADLTLDTTTGSIPASTRVYYKYTYVDASGIETSASPESWVDTPSLVAQPAAPGLSTSTTGGTLQPGNYFYALSAYQDFTTVDTTANNPAYISVGYITATNTITLDLPVLPSGASGFNVYRRGPQNTGYRYLTSIAMDVATPPTMFVDDGGYIEDQDRPLPTSNNTTSLNSVEVAIPGATPVLPLGYSWRIYRTYNSGDYTNSLLVTTTDLTYIDIGAGTSVGQPPSAGSGVGSPSKVLLTDAAEVQGTLPTANIAGFSAAIQTLIDAATILATKVSYAGNTDLASTTVEAALDELDIEKLSRFGGVRHGMVTVGNSGSSATISLAYGNVVRYTLNASPVAFTFPTVSAPGTGATPTVFAHEFWLILTQDGTGSRLVTWPVGVKWPAGAAPTLSTAAGKVDVFRFMSPDMGTSWYGVAWGIGF